MTEELRGAKTEEERALELAYRTLSSRDRTVAEVHAFLERRQIGEAAREHAVAELTAAGFLDDARYARLFTEDKRSIERWGSERIERDLLRRGVPADLVDEALAGTEREEEMAAALAVLAGKLPPPQTDRERDRAWRILVRKGYEPELAYEAVRAHGREVERA